MGSRFIPTGSHYVHSRSLSMSFLRIFFWSSYLSKFGHVSDSIFLDEKLFCIIQTRKQLPANSTNRFNKSYAKVVILSCKTQVLTQKLEFWFKSQQFFVCIRRHWELDPLSTIDFATFLLTTWKVRINTHNLKFWFMFQQSFVCIDVIENLFHYQQSISQPSC